MATKNTKTVKTEAPKVQPKVEAKKEGWEQGKLYTPKHTHVRFDGVVYAGIPVELTEKAWNDLKGDLC